jgi:hypothetical protein
MTTIDNGGPAFPAEWENNSSVNQVAPDGQFVPARGSVKLQGASLRDYFAAKAMPLAWKIFDEGYSPDALTPENIARAAYQMADAMLAARKEKS